MKRLLVTSAILILVAAKPELYREKEDFQYSRSSTDEGSKAGYYGAQRGNMGGNYERAHNMDLLAQHQMSGLVKQVEGELGDGANMRTGSVYTAGNSRGVYGSGRYDLSGLKGRNFDETEASYGNMQNSAFNTHSASESSTYNSMQAHNSRYQSLQRSNAQALDHVLNNGYDTQGAHQSGYNSQAGYNSAYRNEYRNYNNYGSNVKTRLIPAEPARIVIRPGSTVTIPVAAQTYDASHIASAHDENSIKSEAEVLDTSVPHSSVPVSGPKHYESSYSYRKEWERHHNIPAAAVPLAIPTENPFPMNSELTDNTQALRATDSRYQASGLNSHSAYSSNQRSAYDSSVKSASSHQAGYNSNYGTHSNLNADAYTVGAHNAATVADVANQLGTADMKPKSYHSSYSYHKSWERQGDPYIIYPVPDSNSEQSQRLTANAENKGYSAHEYASHYAQKKQRYSTYGGDADCDENGHIRVARSVHQNQYEQWPQDLNQQSQNLGQETQNLRYQNFDAGQETQTLYDFNKHSQNIEDLGQQTQNLQDFGRYNQNLEDLGQETQNLQDFGRYSQNSDDLVQETQSFYDFGRQARNKSNNLEDTNQQSQSSSGQMQNSWSNQSNLGSTPITSHQTQNNWNDQQSQGSWGDQVQGTWDNAEDQQLQTQGLWTTGSDQVYQETNKFNNINESRWRTEDQHTSQSSKNEIINQNVANDWNNFNGFTSQNTEQVSDNTQGNAYSWSYLNQQTQKHNDQRYSSYDHNRNYNSFQMETSNHSQTGSGGRNSIQSLWDKLNKFDQVSSGSGSEYSNTQNYNENSWGQTNKRKNNSQTLETNYGSNNDAHNLWTPIHVTEKSSVTIKPTTTEKPETRPNIRPQDIGRGDIGDEELIIPNVVEKKPFKTSDEIESWSLTKENKTNTANIDSTHKSFSTNQSVEKQQNDSSLSVLSIDAQRENKNVHNELQTSTTNQDVRQQTRHSQNFNGVISSSNQEPKEKPHSQNNAPHDTEYQNTDQQFEIQGFVDQQNENGDEQQQNSWGQSLQDFHQQEQSAWKPGGIGQNQYVNQQSQQLDNLGQQNVIESQGVSYSTQQLEDFGQQQFSPWNTEHALQQQSEIQHDSLGRSNYGQLQSQDFYNQRYSIAETSQVNKSLGQSDKQVEFATTSQPATEKPGFWKSVGNKFSSAKEKVVSWWKS